MKRRNLAKGNLKEIPKKIREQRYATPLNGSAVGRKGLRVYDGGWIRIENGGLQVTGTAIISGVLDVTGTTNLSGTTNISGPLNVTGATTISGSLDVTGPTNLDGLLTINGDTTITGLLDVTGDTTITGLLNIEGDTTISGTLDIDGVTTLNNDLNVTNSGEINVGSNMTLTPTNDGGSVLFQDGSKVTSVGGVVQLIGAGVGAQVRASLNTAQFQVGSNIMGVDTTDWFAGNSAGSSIYSIGSDTNISSTNSVDITSPTTGISGNLNLTGWLSVASHIVNFRNLSTTSNAPNLWRDPASGRLYASTWTP